MKGLPYFLLPVNSRSLDESNQKMNYLFRSEATFDRTILSI